MSIHGHRFVPPTRRLATIHRSHLCNLQGNKAFPQDELFGLTNQLRRAAVSIPSNIAEGQIRATSGEFKQFLCIARGSLAEFQTQLLLARGLGFATEASLDPCDLLAIEVSKMLNALILTLPQKPGKALNRTKPS